MQKQEPLASFRFIVEIGGNKVVAAYRKFSGIKFSVDMVKARSGDDVMGVMSNVPALTNYQNVTLEQGVVGDSDFVDWIYSVTPDGGTPPSGSSVFRTIDIVALNGRGQRAVTWYLYNAVPVAYELSPMDGMISEVLSESVEFSFSGFSRTANQN